MTPAFVPSDEVARIRRRLDHPVIDSDGHLIEFFPLVRDNIVDVAGESVAAAFDQMLSGGRSILQVPAGEPRRRQGRFRTAWWGIPTSNTLDRATAMFPKLLYQRLDELGIDFAVLYPTGGLAVTALASEELRRAAARAYNRYYAEAFADYRDRLEPVAAIPCFTPEEAIEELSYAVDELGLKSVMLAGVIPRPYPGAEDSVGRWMDTLAHESPYDYEPLWAALDKSGVAATFHASGQGWGTRMSTSNYMYNHVGNFAAAGEAIARSLVFAGVPRRYPRLRFAFQEGGVAVACSLLSDLLGHWSKRNTEAITNYDPNALDLARLAELFDEFATGPLHAGRDRLTYGLGMLSEPESDPAVLDEFAASGITSGEDLYDIFTRQYHFGCEADDPMNAMAFNRKVNPGHSRLRAVFASDIGHWDVPDFRNVLPEAWELVADGHLTEGDFREFVFGNAVSLWAGSNPAFFDGTVVEGEVRAELEGLDRTAAGVA